MIVIRLGYKSCCLMRSKKGVFMIKKKDSTVQSLIDSLNPKEKKEFDEGLRDFALSELILAMMENDELSVRRLAEIADLSPTVIQAMRSGTKKDFSMQSFFKVLK